MTGSTRRPGLRGLGGLRPEDHLRRRVIARSDHPPKRYRRPRGSAPARPGSWCRGYHLLAAAITEAQLRGDEKGRPLYDLEELGERSAGQWMILTGCRKGHVRSALSAHGIEAAAAELGRLASLFGHDHVAVEITDAGLPTDSVTNDALAALAARSWSALVATNNVHYATPDQYRLASAMAAVRGRRGLARWTAGCRCRGTPALGARDGFAFHPISRSSSGIRTDRG